MDQLAQLFDHNPLVVINYSCDLDNDLERHRCITFGRWYLAHLKDKGVARKNHTNKSERLYAAVLYREDNPYMLEIEATFLEIFNGK